jgi:hypothetical protein
MKTFNILWICIFATRLVFAQDNSFTNQTFNLSTANSKQRFQQLTFTTPAYRNAAMQLVIGEANRMAQDLNLPEPLPIVESNLVAAYIPPPGLARRLGGGLGNITTSNYIYYVSISNKLSFLDHSHLDQERAWLRNQYRWPISRMDTNAAYQTAMRFLKDASMNVSALSSNCDVHIEAFTPEGENGKTFVPIYSIFWTSRQAEVRGAVAVIEYCDPNKTLLKLRVNQSEYILRKPLKIANLDYLLSQTNAMAGTNAPTTQ